MGQSLQRAAGAVARVLIIDDSALVRTILRDGLARDPRFEVVGVARDPYEGRELLVKHRPDVLTLDVEMPRMDGVTFLRHIMAKLPTPVVMVSSLTGPGKEMTIQALEAGAVDIIEKPRGIAGELGHMMKELSDRVYAASQARVEKRTAGPKPAARPVASPAALSETSDKIIAIGSSTGGVAALTRILPTLPAAAPGVVITQHMPPGFTRTFATRLNENCQVMVKEAEDGDRVRPGLVLIAPGGEEHMGVVRRGGEYRVRLKEGELVSGHRPSVDVLFASVAQAAGKNAVAAILTGMGHDGAAGMLKMRQAGARCFAQDEASSVIWGMPGSAVKNGAAQSQVPLDKVVPTLLASVTQRFSSF